MPFIALSVLLPGPCRSDTDRISPGTIALCSAKSVPKLNDGAGIALPGTVGRENIAAISIGYGKCARETSNGIVNERKFWGPNRGCVSTCHFEV